MLRQSLLITSVLFASGAYAAVTPTAAAPAVVLPSKNPYQELLLTYTVNQEDKNQVAMFLQTDSGQVLVSEEELKSWQIIEFPSNYITYDNQKYYYLTDLKGTTYHVDTSNLTISINIPYNLFNQNSINVDTNTSTSAIRPTNPGGFLNYDINTQKSEGGISSQGALWQVGYFNPLGVGTSDFVTTHTFDSTRDTRLNTTWTYDQPEDMRSWRLGDSYSSSNSWGTSVGFGGIQFARNFNTEPNFITFPLPSTTGKAVIPTTVNLFVNNNLVSSQKVSPGPFAVTNIPVVTGQGVVTVVTTDLLGREQVVSLPYYSSTEILKQGLHDYSFEGGAIRENYGVESNDYGPALISGTDRYGITDKLTSEWHAESVNTRQQTAGGGLAYNIANLGTVNADLAASHSPQGQGGLATIGIQHQAFNGISFGANSQVTTSHFTQAGYQDDQSPPVIQNQVFMGAPFWNGASLGLSYTQQNNRENSPNTSIATLSLSQSFWKDYSVSLSGLKNIGGGVENKAVFVLLTHSLTQSISSSAGYTNQNGDEQGTASITRNLPVGPGFGYNVNVAQGSTDQYQTTLTGQTNYGTYTAQGNRQDGVDSYRLDATGGIATMDKQIFFTRQILDSFGVVNLGGVANTNIYVENQNNTTTNKNGYALIPNLRSYQDNKISVKPEDIPFDAQISGTEVSAVPYYRSGVLIRFPVQNNQAGVTLQALDNDGVILPAGTIVTIDEQKEEFLVANNGELYISGLSPDKDYQLLAVYGDKKCHMTVKYEKSKDPLPDLGPIKCA